MAAIAAWEAAHFREHVSAVVRSERLLEAAETVAFAQKAAESARERFLLTGRARDHAERDVHAERMLAAAAELAALAADDPEQSSRARAVLPGAREAAARGQRMIDARRGGGLAGAVAMMDETVAASDLFLKDLQALSATERRRLVSRRAARLESASFSRRLMLGGLLAALLTAVAGAVLTGRAGAARSALEEELGRSRTLMKAVLDNLDASVYVMDLEGRMLFVNRECARTLGGSEGTMAGRSLGEFLSRENVQMVLDNNQRVYNAGKAVELEEAVRSADGDRVYLSRKAPLAAELYPFPVICGVSTDITALKSYERRLEEANRDLESFTYSVSHDLRAPLRAVDGFARILVEDHGPSLDREARRLLGLMQSAAKRMGALIDDLLTFSRLGRQELRRVTVDMKALARLAAEEAAAEAAGRSVELRIEELPDATGDPAMLAQVWRNLLSNAFKYTRGREPAHVEVGGLRAGRGVEYWVRDDGAGFDPRYAHKLFVVFSRLHSSAEFEGTGVGLALVKRVVDRHGGSVSAEGALGRGATFRFRLPREDA